MERSKFLECLRSNSFSGDVFKFYYEESNKRKDIEWNPQYFNMWLQQMQMFGLTSNSILQNVIIPYYKQKFNITELLNKEGQVIKIND
jgi:hypothetical protein